MNRIKRFKILGKKMRRGIKKTEDTKPKTFIMSYLAKFNKKQRFLLVFIIIIFFISAILAINLFNKGSTIPARLDIIKIIDPTCYDCYDINPLIDDIEKQNVNIKSITVLNYGSTEAQDLIEKYNIKKIPTMIISGETDKSIELIQLWSRIGTMKDDKVVIIDKIGFTYIDTSTGGVRGRINVYYIKHSLFCDKCVNLYPFLDTLKRTFGLKTDVYGLDYSNIEDREIMDTYDISVVPTLVLSSEASLYLGFEKYWENIGHIEENGDFVLDKVSAPYINWTTKIIEGQVILVYINDSSCKECYDVTMHKKSLEDLGIKIVGEFVHDVTSSEGNDLIDLYNITMVPTVLISPEAKKYTGFDDIWKNIGTIEDDGWYIFRSAIGMVKQGGYMDLTTNEFVQSIEIGKLGG